MPITAAAQAGQPDYLALVMVLVFAVIVALMVLRKHNARKAAKAAKAAAPVTPEVPEAPAPTAPGSAGRVKLHGVEPKTAAMLMAIVADKLGKPLNELRFISIKEVQ